MTITLRYPEDEGFARRALNRRTGTIIDPGAQLPGETRLLVRLDNSETRALIEPRELTATPRRTHATGYGDVLERFDTTRRDDEPPRNVPAA